MSFELLKESIKKIKAPNALLNLQVEGLSELENLPLPHRRIENWKYTNLRSIFEKEYKQSSGTSKEIPTDLDPNFHHLVFNDGNLIYLSDEIKDIVIVEKEFNPSDFNFETYYKNDFISILNKSSISNAHKITIKSKANLSKPLFIHHSYTESETYNNYNCYISCERSAEAAILEEITSQKSTLINHKTIVKVLENAKISHNVLQNISIESTIFYQVSAQVSKDANFKNNIINLGAKLSRTNFYGELTGENSEMDANGLYLLNGDQHHDTMSYIKHISPRSYSNQLYKGVLDDSSRGVFSGIIRIDQDAQEVNSVQMNKNLILSTKAHANSRPQLEIYADDVKCAHGSTTGQLNQDELFYFESRGITPERARNILSQAFVFDVVLKIENTLIRSVIQKKLLESNKVVK